MRKWICAVLALGLSLSLVACGKAAPEEESPLGREGTRPEAAEPEKAAGGDLALLYHMQRQYAANFTEDGYYRLTLERERLSDGRSGRRLMYIDFATRQEICLCSNAACAHDTADCPAVFPDDEFAASTALFVWGRSLYILSKEQDHDGSVTFGLAEGGSGPAPEASPAVLYRADLDGTDREKIYTFDPSVTVEDLAAGDGGGLYLVTKKVTTQQDGGSTYQTSSERALIYLDLSLRKETALFSMDFGGNIDWDIIGCSGRELVLYGIDFGRPLSDGERLSGGSALYDRSSDVFALLDVDSGSFRELYRVYAPTSRSYAVDENKLYYSVNGSGQIVRVDLAAGEQTTLCTIVQDAIWGLSGDRLYTRDSSDCSLYFIRTDTGEISHCSLTDRSTGSSLKLLACTEEQALVIYDSDVTPQDDGSYTVHGYRYALIRLEDLYAGRDAFLPIQMIESGL